MSNKEELYIEFDELKMILNLIYGNLKFQDIYNWVCDFIVAITINMIRFKNDDKILANIQIKVKIIRNILSNFIMFSDEEDKANEYKTELFDTINDYMKEEKERLAKQIEKEKTNENE